MEDLGWVGVKMFSEAGSAMASSPALTVSLDPNQPMAKDKKNKTRKKKKRKRTRRKHERMKLT
uniref:Uncharacterized protein n=1 Tax=Nelumbo nucifera TaxID=4432 RepID=A0A822XXP3_NELNU|nr:TPA_asm: hypothetical protein HUJ06_025342 [Nelumbo nucifera]